MAPSRLSRLRALFDQLKDRPPAERDGEIRRACADDVELERDLRRLLSAHDQDSSVLERPAYELAGLSDGPADRVAAESIGRRVGPYTIEGVLGRGGMGVVYRATSDAPRRAVALKVVRGRLDDERSARLEREARLLADLAHPGIVPLFDSGRTDDGAPWFAMELVLGVPLDRFTREHALPRDERLRLFLELAEAVAHAHRKGIIHRDLKPANVLVCEAARTGDSASDSRAAHLRVLDFGLAARTSGLELTLSTRLTEPGRLLGTLAYMSPEQARSEDVDQRTDVYALGVILYELLTDARPVDVTGSWIVEAMERIAEAEPRAPRTLDPSIGRDLATVAMVALAKDPNERYQSVAALAEDVRRTIDGAPILVRPPGPLQQLGRAIERHRATSAALAALLVLFVAAGAAFAARERAHVAALTDETNEAEAIVRFQDRLFESEADGADPKLEALLDRAASLVDSSFPERPLVAATVRHTLGRTYDALGLYDAAAPQLERSLSARVERLGDRHPESRATLNAWAMHLLRRGEAPESADAFAKLEADERAVAGGEAIEVFVARSGRATALRYAARLDEAEALYRSALEGLVAIAGPDATPALEATDGLISTLRLKGATAEAEELLRDLLPRARRVLGEDAPLTEAAVSNLSRFLQMRGRLDEADALQSEVLERRRALLGEDHPMVLTALNNLASIRYGAGKFAEAARTLEDVAARKEAAIGRHHPSTLMSLANLCVMYSAAGRHDDAIRLIEEVLAEQAEALGEESYVTIGTRNARAQILLAAGKADEGIAAAREAAELSLRVLGGAHRDTQLAWSNLGAQLRNLERLDEAIEVLERTVLLCDDAQGMASTEAQWSRYNLAVTLRKAGRRDESMARWDELRAIPEHERTQERGFGHLLRIGYGNTLLELDRADEAEVELAAGLEGLKAIYGAPHPRTLEAARSLERAYRALGREEEAELVRAFIDGGAIDE